MNPDPGQQISQLIARCQTDEGFKRKLLADPAATLKAEGVECPAGLTIKVMENTDKVFHLVIPAATTELSDEALDNVAGGWLDGGIHINYRPVFGHGPSALPTPEFKPTTRTIP
jgi:hypothetical protein